MPASILVGRSHVSHSGTPTRSMSGRRSAGDDAHDRFPMANHSDLRGGLFWIHTRKLPALLEAICSNLLVLNSQTCKMSHREIRALLGVLALQPQRSVVLVNQFWHTHTPPPTTLSPTHLWFCIRIYSIIIVAMIKLVINHGNLIMLSPRCQTLLLYVLVHLFFTVEMVMLTLRILMNYLVNSKKCQLK